MSLRNIIGHQLSIKPTNISALYWDKVQIWREGPLSPRQYRFVEQHCLAKPHHLDEAMEFNPRWQHRYQLYQPKHEAFDPFRGGPYLINYVETACDLTFPDRTARNEARDYLHCHARRRYQDRTYGVREVNGTRYTARRHAPNQLLLYKNDYCRITGELDCLHIEWRISGSQACRRQGIETIEDLTRFDHEAFWQDKLREVYHLDVERLGRIIRNRQDGTKRKKPDVHNWIGIPFSLDMRVGQLVARSCARSASPIIQNVIDRLGTKLCSRALVRNPIKMTALDDACLVA